MVADEHARVFVQRLVTRANGILERNGIND